MKREVIYMTLRWSLLVGVLMLLAFWVQSCKKDASNPTEKEYTLKSINYSNDAGLRYDNLAFQYGGNKELTQARNQWRNSNQTGDYTKRYTYTGQQVMVRNYDQNNAEVAGSLRTYTLNDKGLVIACNFIDNQQQNVLYEYKYSRSQYLETIDVYQAGALTYTQQYYYDADNELDSSAVLFYTGGGAFYKTRITFFEYGDEAATLANRYSFSPGMTNYTDHFNRFGKSQAYALNKETMWLAPGSLPGRYKAVEFTHTNHFNDKKELDKRNTVVRGYDINGNLLATLNSEDNYVYE